MAVTSPRRVLGATSPPPRDYYSAMVSAVSKLERNTAATRQALFDQALALLVERLRARQATEPEIVRERSALKAAIRRVESEFAEGEARGGPVFAGGFVGAGRQLFRVLIFSAAASRVRRAFGGLRAWPRERKMQLALFVTLGWIIGDLLGGLSLQSFRAILAWGLAGGFISVGIVYLVRVLRSAKLDVRTDERWTAP